MTEQTDKPQFEPKWDHPGWNGEVPMCACDCPLFDKADPKCGLTGSAEDVCKPAVKATNERLRRDLQATKHSLDWAEQTLEDIREALGLPGQFNEPVMLA